MRIESELLRLEREFWSGGARAYLQNVDEDCLVAFTSMAGVTSREEIAKTVGDSQRWENLELDAKGILKPREDVAILTYRASATRGDHETYRALVSSGYVRRKDGWKLMFHQQTPLEDE